MNAVSRDVDILKASFYGNGPKELARFIFSTEAFIHIAAVLEEFVKLTNINIDVFIKTTFEKDFLLMTNISRYAMNPAKYFASLLKRSMKGLGTDEFLLSCVILWRCEIDMIDVKREFELANGKTLKEWIRGDTSGHYKYALYALIGEQRSRRNFF